MVYIPREREPGTQATNILMGSATKRKRDVLQAEKERWGAAVALVIRKHKRDSRRTAWPGLLVTRHERDGLLTPLGSHDNKQALEARRKTIVRAFEEAKAELRVTFKAIPHGDLSMRCFEYEAALEDCEAAIAQIGQK